MLSINVYGSSNEGGWQFGPSNYLSTIFLPSVLRFPFLKGDDPRVEYVDIILPAPFSPEDPCVPFPVSGSVLLGVDKLSLWP